MKILPLVLALGLLADTAHAQDAVRYVRDWMSIPLLAGQARDSAVVHRGLISGSVVTLLETDANTGMVRVRAEDGSEGWLAGRYLSAEPIARTLLERANAELAELRKRNEQLPADQRQAQQRIDELEAANARLQTELETLQRAPDGAAQLEALQKRNATLRDQFNQLHADMQRNQQSRDTEMFRNGGLAIIAGALLALVAARLWPRKKSEWA